MEMWIWFSIINALIIGLFECARKKAVEKKDTLEVIFAVYLIAWGIVALSAKRVFDIELKYIWIMIIKAVSLIVAWLGALYALKHIDIGMYGMISTSRIVFTVLLSAAILGEIITSAAFIGMIIIIIGIILVNNVSKLKQEQSEFKIFVVLFVSCLCNAIASVLDKYLLQYVTCGQSMFWVFLFMTVICWIVLIIKQRDIKVKSMCINKWTIITSILLVAADFFLMQANEAANSKAAIIALIKQLVVVETIILGKLFFKEKKTLEKFSYSLLIIFGIVITLI